jgi:exodeoxyribonuclease VII small subunit
MKKEESKSIKFEDALKRLEKIVEKLEAGDVPLDESLSLYEEGISLFKHCSSKLEEAKKKVEILNKKGPGGKLEAQPFDTGEIEENTKEKDSDEIPF